MIRLDKFRSEPFDTVHAGLAKCSLCSLEVSRERPDEPAESRSAIVGIRRGVICFEVVLLCCLWIVRCCTVRDTSVELALNVAWLVLTLLMVWAWLRHAARDGASRRIQFLALFLAILILLPAISMTDDLVAARNPAEVETCLRRSQDLAQVHALLPAAFVGIAVFAGLQLHAIHYSCLQVLAPSAPNEPLLSSLETRPPPAT